MAHNEALHKTIMEAVNNQLKSNDPPETKKTLNRLIKSGYSETDAKKLIAQCLSVEIFRIMKYDEVYNNERYVQNLNNLPKTPSEKLTK